MSDSPGAPDWIQAAVRQAVEDVRLYLHTAAGFAIHPYRFTAEWASGRRKALNPFGVLATGAGLAGGMAHLLSVLIGNGGSSDSLLEEIAQACAPFAYYAVLGAICHLIFKLFGSKRRLTDSLGVALFAGGGPAIAVLALSYLGAVAAWFAWGRPQVHDGGLLGTIPDGPLRSMVVALSLGSFLAFVICFGIGMAGLHQVRRWASPLALLIALLITSVGLGKVIHFANFGVHPIIWKGERPGDSSGAHWHADLWID